MKRTLTAAFFVVCLDLCLAAVARPGEPIEFDEVMESMRTARRALKSGVFHVVGTATLETGTVGDDPEHTLRNESKRESDVRVLCAFDFDKGLIRSDRTVPTWERLVFQQRVSPGAPPGENRRMIFLRTPDASYHCSGAEGTIEILDRDIAQSSSRRDSG